jgi:hypothetical protein
MKYIFPLALILMANVAFAASEAEIHLKAMLDKYASLTMYEDRGLSITNFSNYDGRNYSKEFNFETRFNEDNSFDFRWTEKPNELEKKVGGSVGKPKDYAVWKNKSGVYSQYWRRGEKQYEDLAKALSSATGISSGLAWMIPRWLSPDIPCPPNLGAKSSELFESTSDTIVIKQAHTSGGKSKLYIDKATYLLKRYEMEHILETGTKINQVVVFTVINTQNETPNKTLVRDAPR